MNFWKSKSLAEMTLSEWESVCDRCGRCCLEKFEDTRTRKVFYTSVACEFLDIETCRCSVYDDRELRLPKCLTLTPATVKKYYWLPKTCAYRRLSEGKDLYDWHPLISEDPESVHQAGISIQHKVISARHVNQKRLEAYIVDIDI